MNVNVLAKAYQVLDGVFRCRSLASVEVDPEGEAEADPAEVLVAACLYSFASAPGI